MRSSNADYLFFNIFLDYSDKDKISANFLSEWKAAKGCFLRYAHLCDKSFGEETDNDLVEHFNCLHGYLYIVARSQYDRLEELNEILDAAPTNEMIEKVLKSVKKEVDRQYFFPG